MTGRIPEDKIQEVLGACDIVQVISRYLPLKQTGKSFKALCPFHEEKTPSFVVFPETQVFKCFGCSKAGNVFKFVMEREKLTFPEAVRMLAAEAGVPIAPSRLEDGDSGRMDLYKTLEWSCSLFQSWLGDAAAGRKARQYFGSRDISEDSMRKFRLGCARPGWDNLLKAGLAKGINKALLLQAGLLVEGEGGKIYDRFRDRLVFPILDTQDRPIAFGARAFGDEVPKYVNSPETPVFTKGFGVYGLNLARREGEGKEKDILVVVEGYTDVILAHQVGFRRAVATLGTAMTPQQAKLLRRYASEVVLVFDADEAGRRATDRGLGILLAEGVSVRVGILPDGLDPFDLCRRDGKAGLMQVVVGAREILDFKLASVRGRHALASVSGRVAAAREVLGTIAEVEDPLVVSAWVQKAAEGLGLDESVLRGELVRMRKREAPVAGPAKAARAGAAEKAVRSMLRLALRNPEVSERALGQVKPDELPEGPYRRVFEVMAALHGAWREVSVVSLTAEGGEEIGELAANLLAGDGGSGEDSGIEGYLAYFQSRRTRQELDGLKRKMDEAVKRGDSEAYERLSREFLQLRRAVDSGGRRAKEPEGT